MNELDGPDEQPTRSMAPAPAPAPAPAKAPAPTVTETAIRGLAEVSPAVARRKAEARERETAEKFRVTPTPTRAAFSRIADHLNFKVPASLLNSFTSLVDEWKASNAVAMAHVHTEVRKAHRQHEVDIEAAAGEPEKLCGMEIRTFEQFQDEFLAKLKSANRQCATIAGRVNILIQPIRLEFAEAIDGLADNLARDEEASAAVFGLAFEPSQTVMQLRKGAVVIRSSAFQFRPTSATKPEGIADFI